MKSALSYLFLIAFLFVFSGCALFDPLPPGKAPDGAIVNNQRQQTFDLRSAVNYMTTSLSIHLLTNPPAQKTLRLDCDTETLQGARMVLEELAPVTGIRETSVQTAPVLKTRRNGDQWFFQLIEKNRVVWQESLDLAFCRKEEKGKK